MCEDLVAKGLET